MPSTSRVHSDGIEHPDDTHYRVVQDPHDESFWWRCYELDLQFRWVPTRASDRFDAGFIGPWYTHFTAHWLIGDSTPEREAVWADLWVRPFVDSPELP